MGRYDRNRKITIQEERVRLWLKKWINVLLSLFSIAAAIYLSNTGQDGWKVGLGTWTQPSILRRQEMK